MWWPLDVGLLGLKYYLGSLMALKCLTERIMNRWNWLPSTQCYTKHIKSIINRYRINVHICKTGPVTYMQCRYYPLGGWGVFTWFTYSFCPTVEGGLLGWKAVWHQGIAKLSWLSSLPLLLGWLITLIFICFCFCFHSKEAAEEKQEDQTWGGGDGGEWWKADRSIHHPQQRRRKW